MTVKIPFYKQETDYTCGLASMRMVLASMNIIKTENELRKPMFYYEDGKPTLHKGFVNIAKELKLNYLVEENASIKRIKELLKQDYRVVTSRYVPAQKVDHYAIVKTVNEKQICFSDPWFGPNHKYTTKYFLKHWFDFEGKKQWLFAVK